MHISSMLTSAANSNISLPPAEVWSSQLPVIDSALSQQSISHISTPEAWHVGLLYCWELPLFPFLTAKVLIWGLRAAKLTLCTYSPLSMGTVEGSKGRRKEGERQVKEWGKRREEKEVILFLVLRLFAENQHLYLQLFKDHPAPATISHGMSNRHVQKSPTLAVSTARVCNTDRLHFHISLAEKDSVTSKLRSSGLLCRFP